MIAIINGRVVTVTGETYEKGTVLVDSGKIAAVGTDVQIPADAEIIDAAGCWVTPGLIDAHTHLSNFGAISTMPGLQSDGNEICEPITPQVCAADAVNPFDPGIDAAMKAGFTTCHILPGSANVIGGSTVVVKLAGHTADEMIIPGKECMKFAFGENPKRCYGTKNQYPVTRMGTAALLRATLQAAVDYSDALKKFENGEGERPKRDAKMEALVPVVRGEKRCRMHAHRADDILTAVRIAKEFKLDFIIEHATEGYKIADVLAKENVTCCVGPLLLGMVKQELWDVRYDNPAQLHKAGVNFCLTADDGYGTQWLPIHVGVMVREGLDAKTALEAITIVPARVLQLEDRIGSLEAGKDADIAIFDGDPLCNLTTCKLTMIDGKVCQSKM